MQHIALVALITTLTAAMSSCATDSDELPGDALAPPGQADDAIVCRFGSAHDSDQKKGCTTPREREEEKQVQDNPVQIGPDLDR